MEKIIASEITPAGIDGEILNYLEKTQEKPGLFRVSLVDSYIDGVLLNSEAIKLSDFSNANHRVVEITAFNYGLSEAYARVRNICNKSL